MHGHGASASHPPTSKHHMHAHYSGSTHPKQGVRNQAAAVKSTVKGGARLVSSWGVSHGPRAAPGAARRAGAARRRGQCRRPAARGSPITA
jgi:hypothetical protein